MSQRWLHIALAILVLAQPAAGAAARVSMMAAALEAAVEAPADHGMPGCHGETTTPPDCCDSMTGATCGMDCGTASPAVDNPLLPQSLTGHGIYAGTLRYAALTHPPTSLYKPPRTS